jgi:hypothetical protein
MSFNGSGTFNINTAGQPVVTGTVISSSVFNALTADLATGLSTCITKDGQTTVTANIPMNSFKFTGLAAGTAATDSVRLGQLQAGAATLITVTGTNTYAGTMTPALSAYAAGNTFTFLVPNTNTTSCTLNIDGLGAKSITRDGTTALVAGDLVANSEVVVVYDGTQFQVLNSNSKTNFNLSGTLTVAGNTTLSGGTANQVQYLNASKVLSGSANLTFDGTTLTAAGLSGPHNGTVGATTPNTGAFTTLTTSSTVTINGGTANGVAYLNGSKVLTTGSALQFSGTYLQTLNGTGIQMQNAGATANWFFETSGLNLSFTSAQNGAAIWSINGSEQMRLNSTGLGIGTSSPSQKLNVATASGNAYMRVERASQTTGQVGLQIGGGTSGTDWLLYQPTSSNDFRLFGNSADRVVVTSAGNVTINAPSSGTALTVTGAVSANGDGSQVAYYLPSGTAVRYTGNGDCYLDYSFGGSSGGLYIRRGPSVSTTVYFDSSGNLTVPAMYGTTVTTPRNVFIDSTGKMGGISSTRASKTNIADLDDVSWLYDLNPVTFNYRKRDEEGRYLDECEDETQYGLIAEDTEPHAPDLCIYDTEGKVSGIHYDRMVTPLLKALHKQKALIEQLTARINALELGNG